MPYTRSRVFVIAHAYDLRTQAHTHAHTYTPVFVSTFVCVCVCVCVLACVCRLSIVCPLQRVFSFQIAKYALSWAPSTPHNAKSITIIPRLRVQIPQTAPTKDSADLASMMFGTCWSECKPPFNKVVSCLRGQHLYINGFEPADTWPPPNLISSSRLGSKQHLSANKENVKFLGKCLLLAAPTVGYYTCRN